MPYFCMEQVALKNKRVLIREDFNVPIENGVIQNDARLRAALPTLRLAIEAQACILVVSHLGRPREGVPTDDFSL